MATYRLKVTGLNIDNLLNLFYSRKIKISNVLRKNNNPHVVIFDISGEDYKSVMSDRVFDKFDVCVMSKHGIREILFKLFSLSGAFVGLIISLLVGVNINSHILNIDVVIRGKDDGYLKGAIIQTLEDNGVRIGGTIDGVSLYDLSQTIKVSSEDISAATVEKEGSTLRVKVYLASNEFKTGDLCATRNGVITSVLMGTGEPNVKVGDVVSEGDTLIKADASGNAVATVLAKVYYMGTVVYNENVEEMKPTGKQEIVTITDMFGLKVGTNATPAFTYFQLSAEKLEPFTNFFLPITITRFTYSELEKVTKFIPYENVENDIKEEAKALAMQNVDSACQIVNIDYTIRREGNIVKVDCFIESLENIAG